MASPVFRPRNIALAAGGAVALITLFPRTRNQVVGQEKIDAANPLNTNGVSNVTKRFSAAGGSETGTPATASKLGDSANESTSAEHVSTIGKPDGPGKPPTGQSGGTLKQSMKGSHRSPKGETGNMGEVPKGAVG